MAEQGNIAALRKALIAAKGNFNAMGANAIEGELNLDAVAVICARMSARMDAALSAPARNCERFQTADEARLAFQTVRGHKVWADIELWDDMDEVGAFVCWLFAKAEGSAE